MSKSTLTKEIEQLKGVTYGLVRRLITYFYPSGVSRAVHGGRMGSAVAILDNK